MRTLLFLVFIATIHSCNLVERKLAKKCCEKTENVFTIGTGKIYIPDIVTNNGDGMNDILRFWADTNITSVSFIKLSNSIGKEIADEDDFQQGVDSVGYELNDTTIAFYPVNVYGLFDFDKAGKFQLKIIALDKSGTLETIEREICFISKNEELPDDFCSGDCFFTGSFTGTGFIHTPYVDANCD